MECSDVVQNGQNGQAQIGDEKFHGKGNYFKPISRTSTFDADEVHARHSSFRPRFETIATCAVPERNSPTSSTKMSTSLQPIPECRVLKNGSKSDMPSIGNQRLNGDKDLNRKSSLISDGEKRRGTMESTDSQDSMNGGTKIGRRASLRRSFRSGLKPLKARFSKRVRNRLVQKNGICNISLVNVPSQSQKFISDIFTTLVDVKWRWVLLTFITGFIISWLTFSMIFYLICLMHGDLDEHILLSNSTAEEWTPCITNINSYISVFLFTFESQTTIGYGFRYPTELCPSVLVTVCAQNMFGVMLQTLMAGVIFAKLARPKKRAETLIFSKNAVICMRDSKLCFLFRVGDMRKSQLAEAHIRMQLIKKRITAEGELLPFHQYDMNVGFDSGLDRIFVMWPITICHVIDEDSPLYDISAEALVHDARFEILVILEGVVESTGATAQARTSYIPNEIFWGHRFEKLITFQRENGAYRIDFSRFHSTYPVATPTFSQKELDHMLDCGLDPTNAYKWDHIEQIENMGNTPYATVQHATSPLRPNLCSMFLKQLSTVTEGQNLLVLQDSEERPPSPDSIDSFVEDNQHLEEPIMKDLENGKIPQQDKCLLSPPDMIPRTDSKESDKPEDRGRSPDPQKGHKVKHSVLREHDIM